MASATAKSVVKWPGITLLATLAACTPALHEGRRPPFFLHDLPIDPELDAEGGLQPPPALATAADGDGEIPVELPVALRLTAFGHPAVRDALEAVVQARADHLTASLLPNPSLMSALTLLPLPGSSFDADTRQGGPPQFDIGISVMLDELLFGKRDRARAVAALGVDLALAVYADQARTRMLQTIVAFHEALLAAQLLQIERDELLRIERIMTVVAQRIELGGAGRVELDRMRVARGAGQRRVLRAAADHANSLARFRACLGDSGGARRAVPVGDLQPLPLAALPAAAELLALARSCRPDWLAATRGIELARAGVVLERRLALPELGVLGGYTRQFQRRAIGFPDASSYGFGIDLTLPIFDRNQGNILRAESGVRSAELAVRAIDIELQVEVELAHRGFAVAKELVETIDAEELAAAGRARASIEEAYRLGGRTLLELLDAQATYREIFRDHVLAHAELWTALHVLNAVIGTEVMSAEPATTGS